MSYVRSFSRITVRICSKSTLATFCMSSLPTAAKYLSYVSVALAAVCWSGGDVRAQSSDNGPVVTNPRLEVAPNTDQLHAVYPLAAQRRGIQGEVLIKCLAGLDHRLTDCVLEEESPSGYGFGGAALQAASIMRVMPKMVDGVPQPNGEFSTKIRFRLGSPVYPQSSASSH